ncbi:MAG: hypothetical protein ACJAZM_000333 [Cyclobacteriaceae bacterium]|jgi:hypothetical protein
MKIDVRHRINRINRILGIAHCTLIICILLLGLYEARSQGIVAESFAQKSILGTQQGYAIKYQNRKSFAVGFFHQSSDNFSFEKNTNRYQFNGIELEIPFLTWKRFQISGSIKGGFINDKFLAMTNEINAKMKLSKNFAIGVASGYRSGYATAAIKVIFAKSK